MSTEDPHIGGGVPAPKGRAKACTACRQVKLKCNAKEVYPDRCSRCRAQNLECRMDPSFKRVPARRQLEEVSNRLINLQRSLGLDEATGLPATGSGSAAFPLLDRPTETAEREPLRRQSTEQDGSESFGESLPETHFLDLKSESQEFQESQWTLGDVTLSSRQIITLFEHFDRVLFRHIPILEPCTSLQEMYQSNDLLFWTVTLVSCRLYNDYDKIYFQLFPHHRTLLSMRLFGSRVTLGTIHALLILCTWPYPVNSQFDDITWVLCGVAINLAMTIGLHKPNHGHEYIRCELDPIAGSSYTRNLTWLACFQISTSMASWLGLPASIGSTSQLETIENLCRDTSLPGVYRAKAEIQRQVSRITIALDAKLDFRTRFSLIKIYEQDLDRVQSTFEEHWCDELEVDWLGAKLYLFGMAFLPSASKPTELESRNRALGAREMLQFGLSAGCSMLNTIANVKVPPTPPGENQTGLSDAVFQMSFYPKHVFRVGAFATFFLIWYLAVDVQASESDKNLARDHVAFTYRLLYSVKNSQEHMRAAKSIEIMARFETMAPKDRHQAANLLINSRLGASFMYSLNYQEDEPTSDSKLSQPTLTGPAISPSSRGGPVPVLDAKVAETEARAGGTAYTTSSALDASTPSHTPSRSSRWLSETASSPAAITGGEQRFSSHSVPSLGPTVGLDASGAQSQYDPSNIFSNAFFQDTTNQNFEFLWQEWDPAVFDDLKMDVDDPLQMGLANLSTEKTFPTQ